MKNLIFVTLVFVLACEADQVPLTGPFEEDDCPGVCVEGYVCDVLEGGIDWNATCIDASSVCCLPAVDTDTGSNSEVDTGEEDSDSYTEEDSDTGTETDTTEEDTDVDTDTGSETEDTDIPDTDTESITDSDPGDGTQCVNGLMWQKYVYMVPNTFWQAETYCQELEHNTYTNWRLPTIDELRYIVNPWNNPSCDRVAYYGDCMVSESCDTPNCGSYHCTCAAINPDPEECYTDVLDYCDTVWSSTEVELAYETSYWYIDYRYGSIAAIKWDSHLSVTCVRDCLE